MRLADSASAVAAWAAASSRSRSTSARFRSVMSRATFAAPMIVPSASRIGETLSETSMTRPSFVSRWVSKWPTRSPRRMRSRIRTMSSEWVSGIKVETGLPTISRAV